MRIFIQNQGPFPLYPALSKMLTMLSVECFVDMEISSAKSCTDFLSLNDVPSPKDCALKEWSGVAKEMNLVLRQ